MKGGRGRRREGGRGRKETSGNGVAWRVVGEKKKGEKDENRHSSFRCMLGRTV